VSQDGQHNKLACHWLDSRDSTPDKGIFFFYFSHRV